MPNSKNTLSAKQKLEKVIDEQISLIFDEKKWISKELRKIAEVTYSYCNETGINTTLFVPGGGLDIEAYKKGDYQTRKKLLLKAKDNLLKLLLEKKNQIKHAQEEIELFDNFSSDSTESDLKRIFINSLIEKNNLLDYCINAIPFELEKAGIDIELSQKEIQEIEKKQEQLDNKLFGGKVKDNPLELVLSYEYIFEKYKENKNNLSPQEQEKFKKILNKLKALLPEGYEYQTNDKPKLINDNFLNYNIARKDYMLGFNLLVEALEKLEHVVESNENAGSISDGPKGVQFPTTKKFDSIKILRFFKLANHEIETHNITDYNGRQLIGNLRGANSTKKDEGVAKLMEHIFVYGNSIFKTDEDGDIIIDTNKIEIGPYMIKTLMGELLNDKELINFLNLSEKIDPDIISPFDRYIRLKRNNKAGVQHKDTAYTRGLFKAVAEINKYIKSKGKEGVSPEDLFLGKIGFEETKKLKNIKDRKEKKLEILKPLFLSDAVYFIVTEKFKGNEGNINTEDFYKYLKDKYQIFNFTLEEIKKISFKTKRNVYAIANIILKTIGKHQITILSKINKKNVESILNTFAEPYNYRIDHAKEKLHSTRRNAN